MTRTILARGIGWTIIALLWVTAAYLLIYYSILLSFGADRLHAALSDNLYNALVTPLGGFNLLVLVALSALLWGMPFLIAFSLTEGILRALLRRRILRRRLEIAAVLGFLLTASLPVILLDG